LQHLIKEIGPDVNLATEFVAKPKLLHLTGNPALRGLDLAGEQRSCFF
jgi:hypothetical protein